MPSLLYVNAVNTAVGTNCEITSAYATGSVNWYTLGSITDTQITFSTNVAHPVTADWPTYNSQFQYQAGYGYQTCGWLTTCHETTEQRIERERLVSANKVKEGIALKRAEELLFMVLSDEQKKQYHEFEYFETVVNDKIYRIKKGIAGNISLLEKGVEKEKFCIHGASVMPAPDHMLAQYLLLHTNEQEFLQKANKTLLY